MVASAWAAAGAVPKVEQMAALARQAARKAPFRMVFYPLLAGTVRRLHGD
jgi:hypothetical protein